MEASTQTGWFEPTILDRRQAIGSLGTAPLWKGVTMDTLFPSLGDLPKGPERVF